MAGSPIDYGNLLCKLCRNLSPPAMEPRFAVCWTSRSCGPAEWLALLLIKAGDVATNPGCHKISSVDHLHVEVEMLKVREHSKLLSAQYLTRCLEPGNVCHSVTTRETLMRRMKEILFTRHRSTVEPMMLADNRKATLQVIHTDAVNKTVKDQNTFHTLHQFKSSHVTDPFLARQLR